jgi:hypothetical protein
MRTIATSIQLNVQKGFHVILYTLFGVNTSDTHAVLMRCFRSGQFLQLDGDHLTVPYFNHQKYGQQDSAERSGVIPVRCCAGLLACVPQMPTLFCQDTPPRGDYFKLIGIISPFYSSTISPGPTRVHQTVLIVLSLDSVHFVCPY